MTLTRRPPSLALALLPIGITMAAMGYQLFVLRGPPHVPLILGVAATALLGLFRGVAWPEIERGLVEAAARSIPVVFIFLLVGMTIGTWILSGTVPYLITLGLDLIRPDLFLPMACIVCAVVSVFTGTSWGTVGTMGLALTAVGEGLGVPMAMTAGAVVSGAWFGDKLSPLSDTTNYTAAIAEVDLYTHIRNLLPTTVPAMLLAILAYAVLGRTGTAAALLGAPDLIGTTLADAFTLNPLVLFPPLVIALTILLKIPPIPGIFLGVAAAGLTAILVQGASLGLVFGAMMSGFVSDTGVAAVDALLTKGGLLSMMWVISLVIIALTFGGALEVTGCLRTIVDAVLARLGGPARLMTGALLLSLGFNFASNAFVAYTIPGRMLGPAFRAQGLAPQNLSRSLEDGATMSAPLIPWNSGGVFVAGTLGVPTLVYAPFAIANWSAPLFGLLWAWTGRFLPRLPDDHPTEGSSDD